MSNPIEIRDRLLEQYLRYYDTPFAVNSESVMRERRELLEAEGEISRDVWLEPIAPYKQYEADFATACADAGAHRDLALFTEDRLLKPGQLLFTHQFESLREAEAGNPPNPLVDGQGAEQHLRTGCESEHGRLQNGGAPRRREARRGTRIEV